uniref:General transcription factor 3C polypeptide 2 n=2 Tax=Schistocephalus solidus TaxID=70667 RepID=A0A0X3QCA4_SCHSO
MSEGYRPQRRSAKICLDNLRSTHTGATPLDTENEEDVASEDSDFKVSTSASTTCSSNTSEAEVDDQELEDALNQEPSSDSSATGSVNVASPNERCSRSHYTSEFLRALGDNKKTAGQRRPKEVVLDSLKSELRFLRHLCRNGLHPFTFYPPDIHLSELDSYLSRQRLMFSQYSLEMVNPTKYEYFIPESKYGPFVSFETEDSPPGLVRKRLHRFQVDMVRNLMFAGGYVKCLSWSPCYISDADVQEDQPSFLAVSTFRSAADRPKYSDLMQSGPGVIQIWRCSGLSLCKRNSTPELRPYLFLAHDWGTLMDMQWLPLPVKMAGRQDRRCRLPPDLTYSRHPDEVAKAVASMLGHLIIACTDGLVRILPIPQTAALDALALKYANHVDRDRKFEPSSSRSFLPLFTFKPDSVLLLAPATRVPSWLGWPVCLAIRNDFPHQLAVGYNSGHLAVFNLACLHPFYAKYSDNLLRPVFLAQLLPGPIVSLALHPLQNNVIIGLGLDRDVHVWDLHDPACVHLSVPEMIWATPRSGIGGIVVWPRSTTTVWIGREEYITPFGALRRIPTELGSLKQPADLPTNLRSYTTAYPVCSPIDFSYWGMEMGLQPTSSMDFSDSLAYLVLGDGSGRIQFFSHPLNSYKLGYIKRRLYLQNHLSWIYQWSLRKLPPERSSSGPPVENAAVAVETDIDWTSSLGVASTVEAGDDLKTSLVAVLKLEQELDFLNLNGLIGEECTNEAGGFDEEAGKEILESNDFYKKTLEESPERPFEAEILAPCKVCNAAGQALCWHKVNDGFHFLFQEGKALPKAKYDFLNSQFCSISKVSSARSSLKIFVCLPSSLWLNFT